MKNIEEGLRAEKLELDKLEVPQELEVRLLEALKDRQLHKYKKSNWKRRIAIACIGFLLISYNLNTLAFYGKKLIGYDQVMNGTLKELNALGKGQIIGKSYTFQNGVIITLDGIMLDENQLIVFYTVKDPQGKEAIMNLQPMISIKGLSRVYHENSGQGDIVDEKKEMKWIYSFESPLFFEKTFDLEASLENETGKISFTLDRNKAMGHSLKTSIQETFKLDKAKIQFKSFVASPTSTILKGSIQNILVLGKDQILGTRMRPKDLNISLIANGREIENQESGIRTDLKGITFQQVYDPLPEKVDSLQIKLKSFTADYDMNQKINLREGGKQKDIRIEGQDVKINKVYKENGNTYVTITTEENTILTKVYLLIEDKKVALKQTLKVDYKKEQNGRMMYTRTLEFPKVGDKQKLIIERMSYTKFCNKSIDIL